MSKDDSPGRYGRAEAAAQVELLDPRRRTRRSGRPSAARSPRRTPRAAPATRCGSAGPRVAATAARRRAGSLPSRRRKPARSRTSGPPDPVAIAACVWASTPGVTRIMTSWPCVASAPSWAISSNESTTIRETPYSSAAFRSSAVFTLPCMMIRFAGNPAARGQGEFAGRGHVQGQALGCHPAVDLGAGQRLAREHDLRLGQGPHVRPVPANAPSVSSRTWHGVPNRAASRVAGTPPMTRSPEARLVPSGQIPSSSSGSVAHPMLGSNSASVMAQVHASRSRFPSTRTRP